MKEKPNSMEDADQNYADRIYNNEWHDRKDLNEVLKVIASIGLVPSKGWHWTRSRSWRCKYIDLRIDMRDGGFILMDQAMRRISLDELRYQSRRDDDSKEA